MIPDAMGWWWWAWHAEFGAPMPVWVGDIVGGVHIGDRMVQLPRAFPARREGLRLDFFPHPRLSRVPARTVRTMGGVWLGPVAPPERSEP